MPLEISEIGVHIAVGGALPPPPPGLPDGHPDGAADGSGDAMTPARQEQIVAACVQQVLRTLRQMQER